LFDHARQFGYVIFTHDLDFGSLLALTKASSPSVIQVRTQNILPIALAKRLIGVIQQYSELLDEGALMVIDETRERVRILPLRS
jgi:predicted nuclease of predicted toxin-antitoxin system